MIDSAECSNPAGELEEDSTEVGETGITGTGPLPGVVYPLKIHYCGECTMPIEYCEYSGKFEKCKQWLERNLPEMVKDLSVSAPRPEGAGEAEDEKKAGHKKRGGKGQPKSDKSDKSSTGTSTPSKRVITVQRAPRGKNKSVTVIKGLAANGIDLKVAAKFFASRFACGSSVTAADEIVIQGDVKDELLDVMPQKWSQVSEDMIEDLGEQKR